MWHFNCYTRVYGVSFEGRQALIPALAVGDVLEVRPEPENPHHAQAQALYYRQAKIGYLRRGLADTLLPDAFEYQAVITQLTREV
jgi:hypothetical protein